ncbi:lipopolysaccharide biosynthesis protein [Pseudonocardia pini]|uniref:lipopolysaccharide biosynthesis protein n=1 Tax=Pseudonocardia pini TaxID=2758030 RepID=UPI0015F0C732|nr:hypothetical protein [Pseudonocardia pini]
MGLALLGLSAYVVLAAAGHSLSPDDYAAVASLYLVAAVGGPGVFLAVEQETNREISRRRVVGDGLGSAYRTNALSTAILALVVTVVLLCLGPILVPQVLGGSWGLLGAAVLGSAGAAAAYLMRGLFAGTQSFSWYSSSLGIEGLTRIVPCIVLVLLASTSPLAFGFAFAGGTVLAAVLCLPGLRRAQTSGSPLRLGTVLANTGALAFASLLTYVVANVAPLVMTAKLTGTPELAASYVSLFVIARIPVFLFAPFQAFLLPSLTAGAARADAGHVRSRLTTALLMVCAVGLPSSVALALAGPWIATTLFAAPLELPGLAAGALGVGTVLMLAAQTLQPATIALGAHKIVTTAWGAGAVVYTALLASSLDPVTGAITAQVVAPAVVATILIVTIVVRLRALGSGSRPVESTDEVFGG